ncbi:class I SAM-dependent methyltransferase [Morganella morganii]|uniref:class I SAM-dependent methyltransferase n=1 Tax=Morganella morganii TaxID=582 RepID=UPI002367F3A5|nr:class I SAM-dependent methyltransferase [Morganella morganii]
MELDTYNGIKAYTPLSLKLYDWWVLMLSNNYAWRCNTNKFLIPHFRKNIGINHMDVGVGSGFYLKSAEDKLTQLTLIDLNPHSLEYAKKYIPDVKLQHSLQHDIYNPLPEELNKQFNSISIFYLLHCLPGTMTDKKKAVDNISCALKDDGVLFGATIIGKNIKHNYLGRKLISNYNQKGIFSNYEDSVDSLQEILSSLFFNVDVNLKGTVALFTAKNRK